MHGCKNFPTIRESSEGWHEEVPHGRLTYILGAIVKKISSQSDLAPTFCAPLIL